MPIPRRFPGAAEGDLVQNRDIILNNGSFSDHHAGGMIEEDTAAQLSGRVDVDSEIPPKRDFESSRPNRVGYFSTFGVPRR